MSAKQSQCRQLNLPAFLLILLQISVTNGFYLPGLAPKNFCKKSDATSACKVSVDGVDYLYKIF